MINVCVVGYLTYRSWYGHMKNSPIYKLNKILATYSMEALRETLSRNKTPFAKSGSMKYACTLDVLCVVNPLRGIQYS